MSEVREIVEVVNRQVPEHGRGVIDPEKILKERRSSCFGKVALVGSALLGVGVAEDELRVVVSENHGIEFDQARFWLGHAGLIVLGEGSLVDGMNELVISEVRARLDASAYEPGEIAIDKDRLLARKPAEGYSRQELINLQKLVGPPDVHRVAHQFRVYGFGEGLAAYQAHHPDLAKGPQYSAEDYGRCYRELAA